MAKRIGSKLKKERVERYVYLPRVRWMEYDFSVREDFTGLRTYLFVCFSFIGGTWIERKKFKLDLETD